MFTTLQNYEDFYCDTLKQALAFFPPIHGPGTKHMSCIALRGGDHSKNIAQRCLLKKNYLYSDGVTSADSCDSCNVE